MAALVLPLPGSQLARFLPIFIFVVKFKNIQYIFFLILSQFGNVGILVLVILADGDISSLSGLVVFSID